VPFYQFESSAIVKRTSTRLAPNPLRAYEAIQLATAHTSAVHCCKVGCHPLIFVSADDELLLAAEPRAGDRNPNLHP